ncbi:hypothetical protein HEP86_37330 [Streptomyces sp. RPA4-5]|uniref:hypothetical protein n=1 Tax=Streptomyces sp. RPA4-5 TaxID=2721245 RepID=UPI00143EEDE4|nr:hypothetical protein [Streptomyces sp. RPA4-5]QIY59070.1 hypothetical protein HEP86_37330 [Streptomyces sp. RPA4-5]
MTSGSVGSDILRRHFVAIATSTYEDPTWWQLDGVEREVGALRDWLCADHLDDRRFAPKSQHLAENPSADAIWTALRNPPYNLR